jgi:hypothetical protein
MNFYWIYDIPNWLLCVLVVLVFNTVALGGLIATRPLARRFLKSSSAHNEVVSFFFAGIGVFYGLALGLIAVGTWQNFTEVDSLVGKEAAELASLYRDFDGYSQPFRRQLEDALRDYTKLVVENEWPAHQKGQTPERGTIALDDIENQIMAFEPRTERDKIVHAEVLHSLHSLVELRRMRLQSVPAGLPAALWCVVMIGAWLNVSITYLFWVENFRLHAILVALLATFIALLVFLTAAMDNPFRGQFSVSEDSFRIVLQQVMKPGSK